MNALAEWAARWRVPDAALLDLRVSLTAEPGTTHPPGTSEAAVQATIRVRASQLGWRLWRNNVGAMRDPESGAFLRYGLANDSAQLNAVVKSADLIGIRPRVIAPGDVGQLIGQFASVEVKHAGWRLVGAGSDRERAQFRWAEIVESLGGYARVATDPSGL